MIDDWPGYFQPGARTAAGAEHYAWLCLPRWVKGTYGIQDCVGIAPRVNQKTGFDWILGVGNANAYLTRLTLTNQVFTDDIVLHAVLSDEYGTVSVITSQPDRAGEPVDLRDVEEAMRSQGFTPLGRHAYYRPADNIAVFDLHEENVVRIGDVLYPFDPIVCQPSGTLREVLEFQARRAGA